MSVGPKSSFVSSTALPHDRAVESFVDRVEAADLYGLRRLILFGSVARSTHGDGSDIDVLAVLNDEADEMAVEERLRDIAYDVMLERGTVFSIHGVTESTLERRADHPFFKRALADGERIYG